MLEKRGLDCTFFIKIIVAVGVCVSFGFVFYPVMAFVGPSAGPGTGGGALWLDPNGNLGFGTTTATPGGNAPDDGSFGKVFTIASSSNPGLSLRSLSPGGRNYVLFSKNNGNFSLWDVTAGQVRLFVTPTGNIGIGSGVTAPAQKLHVFGGTAIDSGLSIATTSLTTLLDVGGNALFSGTLNAGILSGVLNGDLSSARVTGNASFASYVGGTNNFSFPNNVAMGTTTYSGLPQTLSVYGGGYFRDRVVVGTTTAGGAEIAIQGGDTSDSFRITDSAGKSYLKVRDTSSDFLRFQMGDSGGTETVRIDPEAGNDTYFNAGDFGIGTINPTVKFDVHGISHLRGAAGATGLYVNGSSYVGIGTTVPDAPLHIYASSTSPYSVLTLQTSDNAASMGIAFRNSGTSYTWFMHRVDAGANDADLYFSHGPGTDLGTFAPQVVFKNNGRVGIGQGAPAYKLDVVGQINSSAGFCISGDCKTSWTDIASSSGWIDGGATVYLANNNDNVGIGTASVDANYKITTSGGGIKAESTNQPAGYFNSTSGYGLIVNTGNVGIGTAVPQNKLDVYGPVTIVGSPVTVGKGIAISDEGTYKRIQTYENEPLVINSLSNNVGIGLTSPTYKLDVANGDINIASGNVYRRGGTAGTTVTCSSGQVLATTTVAGGIVTGGACVPVGSVNGSGVANRVAFWTAASDLGSNANFYWDNTNNRLAVGTSTTPSYPLVTYGTADSLFGLYRSGASQPTVFRLGTDSAFVMQSGGYDVVTLKTGQVGVRTTNPNGTLNVGGTVRVGLITDDNGGTASEGNRLYLSGADDWASWDSDNSDPIWLARYNSAADDSQLRINVGDGSDSGDKIELGTTVSGTWTPRLVVRADGNVGIATTTPSERLVVDGNMNLTGTFSGALSTSISARNVTGPAAFGLDYGTYSYAFPSALAIGTSTVTGLPTRGLYVDGSIGVGTLSPGTALEVNGDARFTGTGDVIRLNNGASEWATFGVSDGNGRFSIYENANSNGGTYIASEQANRITMNTTGIDFYNAPTGTAGNAITWTRTGNVNLSSVWFSARGTNSDFYINSSGRVGIGTTSPSTPLHILGSDISPYSALTLQTSDNTASMGLAFRNSGTSYTWFMHRVDSGANDADLYFSHGPGSDLNTFTPYLVLNKGGNVGIATTSAAYKLDVNGTFGVRGATTLYGNLALQNNNITGVNKLTVTTIDPLYEIQGKKYSTYASAVVGGVYEEYVGRAELFLTEDLKRKIKNYEYVIDFNDVPEGTDLWVWRKIVDFSSDNVDVLVTPRGKAVPVSYVVDGNRIVFSGNEQVEFSYRLSGKRVDWQKWPTFASDQSEEASIVID